MAEEREGAPTLQRTSSVQQQPKGILKNRSGSQEPRSPHLKWDEPNLALNDLNRDSTMKITEPKTPFVRYNAETDEVMNLDAIPHFDLGHSSGHDHEGLSSPTRDSHRNLDSFELSRARSSSSTSSRRTSGSTERRQVHLQAPDRPIYSTSDVPSNEDEDEDEELDPVTKAKHEAFVRARKGHYGNEAEAMKRERELQALEDEDDDADEEEQETLENDAETETNCSETPAVPNGA